MYANNFSEAFNFTNQTINTTVPAVYVGNPQFGVQTWLLTIIAFCLVFQVIVQLGRWLLNDNA